MQAYAAEDVASGPKAPWKTLPEVIETNRVPVMLYADRQSVEPKAIQQLIKLAESPMPVSGYGTSLLVNLDNACRLQSLASSPEAAKSFS